MVQWRSALGVRLVDRHAEARAVLDRALFASPASVTLRSNYVSLLVSEGRLTEAQIEEFVAIARELRSTAREGSIDPIAMFERFTTFVNEIHVESPELMELISQHMREIASAFLRERLGEHWQERLAELWGGMWPRKFVCGARPLFYP